MVRAAAKLRCKSAIIDGEAIVQNGHGASILRLFNQDCAAISFAEDPIAKPNPVIAQRKSDPNSTHTIGRATLNTISAERSMV